ncbi:MAG: hypothetical protein V3U02_00180 [Calditrichia bacterium]
MEIETFSVFRDTFVFEKEFDTEEDAEDYARYCRRNYVGGFEVIRTKEENLDSYFKRVDDPNFGNVLSTVSKNIRFR